MIVFLYPLASPSTFIQIVQENVIKRGYIWNDNSCKIQYINLDQVKTLLCMFLN